MNKENITQRLHNEYYECDKCGHKMKHPVWDGSCPKCKAESKHVKSRYTWQEILE